MFSNQIAFPHDAGGSFIFLAAAEGGPFWAITTTTFGLVWRYRRGRQTVYLNACNDSSLGNGINHYVTANEHFEPT